MIVCDSSVAFLASIKALLPTSETLITTPGQYYNLLLRIRWYQKQQLPSPDDDLHMYIDWITRENPGFAAAIDQITSDPDPAVIQIADSSEIVTRAVELALEHNLKSDAAFLFGLAKRLRASLLFTEYCGRPDRYRELANQLSIPIAFLDLRAEPSSIGMGLRENPLHHDRRRPAPIEPQALATVI